MTEEEQYDKICKHEFTEIRTDLKTVLNILKGNNGDPGLCERVRENTKFRGLIVCVVSFLLILVTGQVVIAVVEWLKSLNQN